MCIVDYILYGTEGEAEPEVEGVQLPPPAQPEFVTPTKAPVIGMSLYSAVSFLC